MARGRADWAEILDRWEVGLAAIDAENEHLLRFITADPNWELLHEDEDGALFRRVE